MAQFYEDGGENNPLFESLPNELIQEIEYFESELEDIAKSCEKSLLQKRAGLACGDPVQELEDVYVEVEQLEQNLKRCLQMGQFIIKKNFDLLAENSRFELETDDAKANQTNSNTANIEKLATKDFQILELEGQKSDLRHQCSELTTEIECLKEESEEMREKFVQYMDSQLQQASNPKDSSDYKLNHSGSMSLTMGGTGGNRVSRTVLIQEYEGRIVDLDAMINQQVEKVEEQKQTSNQLTLEIQISHEKIYFLTNKLKKNSQKQQSQDTLIKELEDVINDLTEQITRDKLEEKQRLAQKESNNELEIMIRQQETQEENNRLKMQAGNSLQKSIRRVSELEFYPRIELIVPAGIADFRSLPLSKSCSRAKPQEVKAPTKSLGYQISMDLKKLAWQSAKQDFEQFVLTERNKKRSQSINYKIIYTAATDDLSLATISEEDQQYQPVNQSLNSQLLKSGSSQRDRYLEEQQLMVMETSMDQLDQAENDEDNDHFNLQTECQVLSIRRPSDWSEQDRAEAQGGGALPAVMGNMSFEEFDDNQAVQPELEIDICSPSKQLEQTAATATAPEPETEMRASGKVEVSFNGMLKTRNAIKKAATLSKNVPAESDIYQRPKSLQNAAILSDLGFNTKLKSAYDQVAQITSEQECEEERDHFEFHEAQLDQSIKPSRHAGGGDDSSLYFDKHFNPANQMTFQVIPEDDEQEASFNFDEPDDVPRAEAITKDVNGGGGETFGLNAMGDDITFDTRPAQTSTQIESQRTMPESLTMDTADKSIKAYQQRIYPNPEYTTRKSLQPISKNSDEQFEYFQLAGHSPLKKSSLLDNMQNNRMQKSCFTQKGGKKKDEIRKDPNEEFFKMSYLAYQLNSQSSGGILTEDPQKLYEEIRRTGKPFFEWPQWIEDTMRHKLFAKKYSSRQAITNPHLQRASKEVIVTLSQAPKIRENFFSRFF